MQQSLLISSFGHFSLLFIMLFYGWEFNKQMDPLIPSVQVSVISISEFDAKVSVAPDLILKKLSPQSPVSEEAVKAPELKSEDLMPVLIDDVEQIELQVDDESFISSFGDDNVQVEKSNMITLNKPKKIKFPAIRSVNEVEGNEKISYASPTIAKPKPRTADRIDKVAVSKSISEKVVEATKEAIKASDDAKKVQEVSEAEAPKEASTKITPEGKKNVPIVVSGAVQSSLPPLSRPKPVKKSSEAPIKRPKASDLLKQNNQSDQIEMLLAQLDSSSEQLTPEVSVIEKNNMMSAIAQKLAKYWEQGILSGNSNFEKYIVQVEVEVNSLGEIIGGVKPLVPRVPKGRYLIAFRQASNALISAAVLPIIPDKYPSGITFEITFDPEEGFSF